ncbi:MAG: T9SS type A sorting domain-containing protein [Bacteroidia bacterium]|nr:T9SS type A sorting domain-containing protein [Bacteroidia bacterium]
MKNKYKLTSLLFGAMTLMSLNSKAQAYCSSGASSTADDEIFNVTVGTLNNTSSCATTGGPGSILNRYSDYTNATPAVAAPVLVVGQNYPMSVTVGQCSGFAYSGYFRVWIDFNQNFSFADPGELLYTSGLNTFAVAGSILAIPGGITIPLTATPGQTRMRVAAAESTIPSDCGSYTWGETEDYNVFIGAGTPCSGLPAANAVVATTAAICPNSATPLSLANSYTVGGITYQWQSSTVSAVGPWTPIAGTLATVTSPSLTTPTFFSAIITCTNGNGSITATSASVQVQPTTTNSVPYFEGFEGIGQPNKLPNCSWQASNLPQTCQTYTSAQNQTRFPRTGTSFASFYYTPAANNFMYSNGIQLEAGVTYSASLWYVTEYYGYTNWNLRMYVGPNQSTVNANIIAQNLPAASPAYKSLSNTFTVATSGLYYIGINAQSNGACCGYYLSFDDLAITVPCQLNTPQVAVTANSQTICAGQSVNLTATGADTYVWNNGATSNAISVNPQVSGTYYVTGTSAASGCTATASQAIQVNPSPIVSAVASKPTICAGESTNITAFSADTYIWSNNANTPVITVSPSSSTSYTVIGANSFGCTGNAVVSIVVNPLPVVNVNSSNLNNLACMEDVTELTGTGAISYQWNSPSALLIGSPVNVSPNSSTTYTLIGTDANGCKGSTTYQLNVTECVGLKDVSTTASGIKLYPNPNKGEFVIEINNKAENTVIVTDLTGRVLVNTSSRNEKISIDLSNYSNGVYYVKINTEVIKVVKQ